MTIEKIKNYTGNPIAIVDNDGEFISGFKCDGEAKCKTSNVEFGELDTKEKFGFNIETVFYGEVEGLPEPEEGVLYVVNVDVWNAFLHSCDRKDIAIPINPKVVINSDGQREFAGFRGLRIMRR